MTKRAVAPSRVILPILSLALLCAPPARAAAPPPIAAAVVEVTELDAGGARRASMRFTLALADRGSSEMEAATARMRYHLRVSRHADAGKAPLLHLELRRERRHGRVNETVKLRVAGRVAPGRPVVLGQVALPGGGSLQVTVRLATA